MQTFVLDTLHLQFVLSTEAHAEIISIDMQEAQTMPGVVRILTHHDCRPGATHWHHGSFQQIFIKCNNTGRDTAIFAIDKVVYFGQPIAAVVATTVQQAKDAAARVRVQYKQLTPIITIEVSNYL